jgi:hypothetical protein
MVYPALSPQTAPKLTRHASRRFLFGAAALAIATAGLSQQVAAQSFQGTPTVLVGNPTFSTSPNKTTIFINGNLTVINWQRAGSVSASGNYRRVFFGEHP